MMANAAVFAGAPLQLIAGDTALPGPAAQVNFAGIMEPSANAAIFTFSGGGIHTNSVVGVDLGHNGTLGYPNGFIATNFSYGRLTLASSNDIVYFPSGNGAASNALYIGELDLAGLTNEFASVASMIASLLHSPTNVNIYYAASNVDPFNSYLNDQIFSLTDIGGGSGGFLLPAVPEPSALMLLASAVVLFLGRRRRS